MRKTYTLNIEGKNRDRLLEASKHDIRKYLKRERNKTLPAGVDYWDFDTKSGVDEANAVVVPYADLFRSIDALLAEGVRLAIVKRGGDGVLLATDEGRWTIPPLPIDVLCGLGAGDAFGGALVHGLLAGWTVPEIGMFANAAGAYVATKLTCADVMPTIEQVELMMEA